jgi:hypothetical protein
VPHFGVLAEAGPLNQRVLVDRLQLDRSSMHYHQLPALLARFIAHAAERG